MVSNVAAAITGVAAPTGAATRIGEAETGTIACRGDFVATAAGTMGLWAGAAPTDDG